MPREWPAGPGCWDAPPEQSSKTQVCGMSGTEALVTLLTTIWVG